LAAEENVSLKQHSLQHDGIDRHFALYAPPHLNLNIKRPLVIVLHGGGGNGEHASTMTGLTRKARQEGFFVVYPSGSSRFANSLPAWNAGHCCGDAMQNKVDDVGFIRNLIDRLARDYPIDPQQVFVTGMSNGGLMTHRLGIVLSDKLTAIAPVVATLFGSEARPVAPVPALIINSARINRYRPKAAPPVVARHLPGTAHRPSLPRIRRPIWPPLTAMIGTAIKFDRLTRCANQHLALYLSARAGRGSLSDR
jgi:polyhydroxybutyrate depolymerase